MLFSVAAAAGRRAAGCARLARAVGWTRRPAFAAPSRAARFCDDYDRAGQVAPCMPSVPAVHTACMAGMAPTGGAAGCLGRLDGDASRARLAARLRQAQQPGADAMCRMLQKCRCNMGITKGSTGADARGQLFPTHRAERCRFSARVRSTGTAAATAAVAGSSSSSSSSIQAQSYDGEQTVARYHDMVEPAVHAARGGDRDEPRLACPSARAQQRWPSEGTCWCCPAGAVAAYDAACEVIRYTSDQPSERVDFSRLVNWMVGRLQGDALAAALFRNVATWCLGLAADWQADLYAAIVDVQWIDCRDGAVYKYGPYDASMLVLAAAACVSHPPGEPMPPPGTPLCHWYTTYRLLQQVSTCFPAGCGARLGGSRPGLSASKA